MAMTCPTCMLLVAGLLERIEELARENAALRAEASEFATAVELEREQLPASVRDETMPGTPRALAGRREKSTAEIPCETMAQVVDGRLK
jgi:hypothetical protein